MINEGPDFLGIGVARSGTTTAYKVLKGHPDIYMPDQKELHFFTFVQQPYLDQPDTIASMEQRYRDRFAPKGVRIGGEISPSYFYFPGAATKIHTFNPHIKLFCILRNPVDRALSDFYYSGLNKKVEPEEFFMQGIRDLQNNRLVLKPFSPSTVLYKGFYRYHVASYVNQFPDTQLLFLSFDLLKNDIETFFQKLFTFLGVQTKLENVIASENAASYPQQADNKKVRELLEKFYQEETGFFEEFTENQDKVYQLVNRS